MKIYYKILILYIVFFLLTLAIIYSSRYLKNIIALSLIVSIVPALLYFAYYTINKKETILVSDKTAVRYTMHCKSCGWEWMSNVSEKVPSVCPNCRSREKAEVIGWRRVRLSSERQKEKDLRKFFNA